MKNSKHQNQVRIIGGTHRGRKLSFQNAEGLRPTPDMVREKLFNWLGQDLTGLSVLDLFAGSGALGFEAASRNAKQVILVEKHAATARQLKQIAKELNVNAQVNTADGIAFLASGKTQFDVVFLDPPFAWQNWAELFAALKCRLHSGAFVYLEAGKLPELPTWLSVYRQGKSGMSQFLLLKTDFAAAKNTEK